MELSDLKPDVGMSLEDFRLDQTPAYSINTRTASLLAASEILMSEEPSVQGYTNTRDGLLSPEGRSQFVARHEARRADIMNTVYRSFYQDLLDPDLTDQQKLDLITAVEELPNTFTRSTNDLLAQAYVQNYEDPEETERTFQSRINMVDMLQAVNRYKEMATKAVNGVELSRDPSSLSTLADFGELLVPFAELIHVNRLLQELGGESDAVLLGNRRRDLYDLLARYSPEQKERLIQFVVDTIEQNDSVILPDGNDLLALEALSNILINNDYSDVERWVDNATTVLDAVGVGVLARNITRSVRGARMSQQAAARFEREAQQAAARNTQSEVVPTSPSQLAKEVAPEEARVMHDITDADRTEEAAQALYGTSRENALANDLLPEADTGSGVRFKPDVAGPQYNEPADIRLSRTADGRLYLTEDEIAATNARIISRLDEVEGFQLQPQSISISSLEDGSTQFTAMYHPHNAGWRTADEAIENAKYALRDFGATEKDLVLYRRVGSEWVETSQAELTALRELRDGFTSRRRRIPDELREIDYAVGLRYNHRFSATDDVINTTFDVHWNFFDRFRANIFARLGQGSVTQNLMPIASVLDPTITGSAAVAVDRAFRLRKQYVELFEGFTDAYKQLPKDRRAKVLGYIQEANLKGVRLNETQLRSRGFSDAEIGALQSWRRGNDALYYATNADLVNTLRNRGYRVLTNGTSTRMFVRPISDSGVSSRAKIYHAGNDEVMTFDRRENITQFTENGGSFVRLHEPTLIDGEWVDIVAVPNTKSGGYLRALSDNDTVLAYREGYYPVIYDANWFVRMEVTNSSGETFMKTIGSAKTQEEAITLRNRIAAEEAQKGNDTRLVIDPDRTSASERYNGLSEDGFSATVSSSLSAQKLRGDRLIDAGADYHLSGHTNILDPLEAVAVQIARTSSRVRMRNWFEATKQRWINNYFDELGMKPNEYGERWFPSDPSQIPSQPGIPNKTVADARTLFNYIHSMENGWINGIDEAFKAAVNSGADFLGGLGLKGPELWGKSAAKVGPMGGLKGVVFKAYLAANPLRQAVIQGHQTVQLTAIAPEYMLTGGLASDLYRIGKVARGNVSDAEAVAMYNQLRASGMIEAVDANNLIRSDMLRLADRSNLDRIARHANAPINAMQRVGFDLGEQTVLVTSWLAHRNKAVRDGVELTQRELERIAARARAYTYNMNKAGDMPYNTNTLSALAQFLQVPHKAMLQPLTDRNLSRMDKARLLTWNTVMYGVPAGIFADYFSNIEDGVLKDGLQYGFEDVLLNGIATALTGQEQSIDWGDLAPTELHGTSEFFINLITLDIGRMVHEMPAYNLLFSSNSRLSDATKTLVRYVYPPADYEDPTLETKLSDVAIASLSMFSGFSNAFKARYAAETGRALNSNGRVTDDELTAFESAMQAFGFRTKSETAQYALGDLLYSGDYQDMESDVRLWYTELKRHLARRGETVGDQEAWRVLAEGWRVFGLEDVRARQALRNAIQNDIRNGDYDFVRNIHRRIGISTPDEVRRMIALVPDQALRRTLQQDLDVYMESVRKVRGE